MHDWRRLGPCSDTTLPYWEVARGSEKEPSIQQVVDLGPHLGRIVVVWPSTSHECRSSAFPARRTSRARRRAAANPAIQSAMNRHRHLPLLRQCRRHDPSDERAGNEQLHTDLDMRHVVPVQHSIAAATVDPACMQACPPAPHPSAPARSGILPGGRRRHHCCRASHDVCHGYLIAHVHTSHRSPVFSTQDAPTIRCRV